MASSRSSRLDRFVDTFAAYPWWISIAFGGFMIVVINSQLTRSRREETRLIDRQQQRSVLCGGAPAIAFTGTAVLSKILEKRNQAALARN